jgi:hypothetical protein
MSLPDWQDEHERQFRQNLAGWIAAAAIMLAGIWGCGWLLRWW